MLKIGITGGIGSGKTTVCKIFELLGIPVFNADGVAKELMAKDDQVRKALTQVFGSQTFDEKNKLNRAYLAQIVFNDEQKLQQLNQIVHPAVFRAFDDWCAKQSAAYVVKEAALLFESGSYQLCDQTILVQSPEDLKIQRIIKRDGATPPEIKARMSKQMSDAEKIKLADFVLNNDEKTPLIPQIITLHKQFLKGVKN